MITIATLTQVLYMGMQDDVALLIMDEINLYEHQSSFNPNMPLRLMQYTSNIYETLITLQKKNKYGSKLIPLPVPKLVTFYNGQTEKPEEMILRLSDSFPEDKRKESDIEVRVRMININPGKSRSMVEKCKPLEEYTWTVAAIRKNKQSMDIEKAIDKALDEMPEDFEIRPYLMANRMGVKKMLLTEYNETETMELFREEGRAEGRAEGFSKASRDIALKMLREGLPLELIIRVTGLSGDELGKME
jgi:predicted transposase/invertase (TIGR01784 family)